MDKGYMKGRARLAVSLMIAAAVVAFPAIAHAATFSSELPGSGATVRIAPSTVAVDVAGAKVKTGVISVNSAAKATQVVVSGGSNGGWTYSEVAVGGVYHSVWTFTAGSIPARTTLIAAPGALTPGTINVSAAGTDDTNAAFGPDAWSFTYVANGTPVVTPASEAKTTWNATCISCHPGFNTDNSMGPNCVSCHGAGAYLPSHGLDGGVAHDMINKAPSAACTACHGTDYKNILLVSGQHTGCSCHTYHEAGSTLLPLLVAGQTPAAGSVAAKSCKDCHNGAYAPHGFTASETHGVNAAVSGHNTTELGTVGAKTSFPTLSYESEIATSSYATPTAPAGSPLIGTSLTTGQTGALSTTWSLPTASVFWPATNDGIQNAPATAIKGLTWNSVISCTDCHTGLVGLVGPQGASAANYGLDPNYPAPYEYAELTKYVTANNAFPTWDSRYSTALSASGIAMFPGAATKSALTSASVASTAGLAPFATPPATMTNPNPSGTTMRTDGTAGATAVICAKCHRLETFIPASAGGVNAVEGANTAHDSHHQDQLDGSAQCVGCHIGLPHAWKRPRLLVNTDVDVAPYKSVATLGTTRTQFTGEQTTNTIDYVGHTITLLDGTVINGFGKGYNGQGMQSLSGADNHTLQSTTLGHQGQAFWTEASCQACAEHAGEDGVRIKED